MQAPDPLTLEGYDYAILNPLQVSVETWAGLNVISLAPKRHKAQAHLFPSLLSLSRFTDRDDVLKRSQEWQAFNQQQWFSALLVAPSPMDFASTGKHLSQRMTLQLHTGITALLRFHDPNVFRHLTWLFTPAQMNTLLGPIQEWSWPEPDGQWQTYSRRGEGSSTLNLTQKQENSLARLGELNTLLGHLNYAAPELDQTLSLARRVDGLLLDAETNGLDEPGDRQLFVEQALRYDTCLHQHPQMRERLQRVADGKSSYIRACSDLDHESLWDLVKAQRAVTA